MTFTECADCKEAKTEGQQRYARCGSCANRLKMLGKTNGAGSKGKIVSLEARRNISLAHGGNGDILNRKYPGLHRWTRLVKESDGYKCIMCDHQGAKGDGVMEAHHVVPKALHPELATEVFNGVTLCKPCHKEIHR